MVVGGEALSNVISLGDVALLERVRDDRDPSRLEDAEHLRRNLSSARVKQAAEMRNKAGAEETNRWMVRARTKFVDEEQQRELRPLS
eukprot:766118-Hanusia_phi.AAC.2